MKSPITIVLFSFFIKSFNLYIDEKIAYLLYINYLNLKKLDKVYKVYQEIKSSLIVPDILSYRALFLISTLEDQTLKIDECIGTLLYDMKSNKVQIDIEIANILFNYYFRTNQVSKVKALFDFIKKQNVESTLDTYKILIDGFKAKNMQNECDEITLEFQKYLIKF